VSVDVTNTGVRAGREVVQLYVRDDVASFTRPVRELRGFEHLQLEPGGKATVRFDLDAASMSLLDERWKRIVEAGTFTVYVGTNSRDCLSGTFEVTGR
jgi:beta-glucosidase